MLNPASTEKSSMRLRNILILIIQFLKVCLLGYRAMIYGVLEIRYHNIRRMKVPLSDELFPEVQIAV